jgi:hypothetical protein
MLLVTFNRLDIMSKVTLRCLNATLRAVDLST